jgi:hypothetical protein
MTALGSGFGGIKKFGPFSELLVQEFECLPSDFRRWPTVPSLNPYKIISHMFWNITD